MVKNYFFTLLFLLNGICQGLLAQESQLFKVNDFDLTGKVKACMVVTNYGKEEYEFDKAGRLTKSITRFSDSDYDINYYKHKEGVLLEKRTENYRDGEFEPSTSFANFFTVDQIEPRKVTEKIFSYDEEFLDAHQYIYNAAGKLTKIMHSGPESEDETVISYKGDDQNSVTTFMMNEVVQKTVKSSTDKTSGQRTVFTTQYLDGKPSSAAEEVFSKTSKLLSENLMTYNADSKKFISEENKTFAYDEQDMLIKLNTKKDGLEEIQEYIYQYDAGDTGNWVKQIITPDNTYTTRKIEYYNEEEKIVNQE